MNMPPNSSAEAFVYRQLFDEKYAEIADLLDGLPAVALLWKPFEGDAWHGPAGSLGWLLAHGISSTYYLLRRAEWVLERRPWAEVDGDERSDEFGSANHDPAYLLARAVRMQAYVHEMLDSLNPLDLDAVRAHPDDPARLLVVRYDVVHALEHLSQHIGHAQLTRQLWARQT